MTLAIEHVAPKIPPNCHVENFKIITVAHRAAMSWALVSFNCSKTRLFVVFDGPISSDVSGLSFGLKRKSPSWSFRDFASAAARPAIFDCTAGASILPVLLTPSTVLEVSNAGESSVPEKVERL